MDTANVRQTSAHRQTDARHRRRQPLREADKSSRNIFKKEFQTEEPPPPPPRDTRHQYQGSLLKQRNTHIVEQLQRKQQQGGAKNKGYVTEMKKSKIPKSRYLFRQNSQMNQPGKSYERRKQLWFSAEHQTSNAHVSKFSVAKSKENTKGVFKTGNLEYRSKNSKFYSKPGLKVYHLRSGGERRDPSNGSSNPHNLAVDSSLSLSNKKITSNEKVPRKNKIKYKYGLRRGLPAVTVENFGGEDHGEADYPSQKMRSWYNYGLQRGKNTRGHKGPLRGRGQSPTTPQTAHRKIEEFGPADAVTDEHRNNLLFEYIRDQKKEE